MENDAVDIGSFRKLPPFEAFTRCAWISIILQTIAGIAGAITSYYSKSGAIGGIMSGIFGLWFVLLAWVMSFPSKCSPLPYRIGLCLLPFSKSVGFLTVPGPYGEVADWPEFTRRVAILTFMWCFPMWMALDTIAEVVRCMHKDVSRYEARNKPDSNTMFGTRRTKGIPIDSDGVFIRERTMQCTVKYIMILPLVVYITFNSIGAMAEASEYSEYGLGAEVEDTFEFTIGRQFYMDYNRTAYSNIFEGLIAVFGTVFLSAFSCSAMDLGEIMLFRFHRWEFVSITAVILFFVAGVYFGSAVFNPIDSFQERLAYWSMWTLPCLLMFSLFWLTRTVLLDKNELTKKRIASHELDEVNSMSHRISSYSGVHPLLFRSFTLAKPTRNSNVDQSTRNLHSNLERLQTEETTKEEQDETVNELLDRIKTLEQKLKENPLRKRNGEKRASRTMNDLVEGMDNKESIKGAMANNNRDHPFVTTSTH